MLYFPPLHDDIQHRLHLRSELKLHADFDQFVTTLAAKAIDHGGRTLRKDAVANTEMAMSVILANVIRAHFRDRNLFVQLSLGNGDFPAGPHNPFKLGPRAVRRTLDYLLGAKPPFLEKRAGNNNRETNQRYDTRIRATKRLIGAFEGYCCFELHMEDRWKSVEQFLNNPGSIANLTLFAVADLPIIRQKDPKEAKSSLPYYLPAPSEEIEGMTANLARYNRFLADHWIDLLIPDEELAGLQSETSGDEDEYFHDDRRLIDADFLLRRKLYRVFNDGTVAHGGRFYGGWWQMIPSRYRKHITINWYTTAEVDFSAMQLNMLYAREGLPPPQHDYQIDGFPAGHRDLLKRSFFKIINAEDQVRAPRKDELPEGWTWEQIQQGLKDLHAPVAKYFNSGIGIELQRVDSDIAERVMMRMMEKKFLALPVHDSFIVWDNKRDLLSEIMKEEYANSLKQAIKVKADASWIDGIMTTEKQEMFDAGVWDPTDALYRAERKPGYEQYRQRRSDFLAVMGERWGHRHSFHA
jgi:hypothetical protein